MFNQVLINLNFILNKDFILNMAEQINVGLILIVHDVFLHTI